MNRMMKAFLLKGSGWVVTDKTLVKNTKDEDFEEVSLVVSMEEIKNWNAEIEVFGLDENDDF